MKTYLVDEMALVRLSSMLTTAEQRLAKIKDQRGRDVTPLKAFPS